MRLEELPPETFTPDAYQENLVIEFTERVFACAQGLVVIIPEYNGSMPGALKLFIDLLFLRVLKTARMLCWGGCWTIWWTSSCGACDASFWLQECL